MDHTRGLGRVVLVVVAALACHTCCALPNAIDRVHNAAHINPPRGTLPRTESPPAAAGGSTTNGLSGAYFTNTALGLAPVHTRVDACLNFGAQADAPGCAAAAMPLAQPNFTARWTGNITSPSAGFYNFTVATDGSVRLWVDDHLLIDAWTPAKPRNSTQAVPAHASMLAIPLRAGQRAYIRLEYLHLTAAVPTLALRWVGNRTSLSVVPQSALEPLVSPPQATRAELQNRHANAGWGNWWNANMLSTALLPAGLALNLGLVHHTTGATLPTTIVFRQNKPAQVSPGPHSYYTNASAFYSEVTIHGWQGLDSVTVRGTVAAPATPRRVSDAPLPPHMLDMVLLVTTTGATASDFSVTVNPAMVWGRVGTVGVNATGATVHAAFPGLPPVTVFGAGAAAASTGNASMPQLSFRLGSSSGVALSSGSPRSPAAVHAALDAARARVAAGRAKYGELADVYDAMQTVVAWNTIYTPYEGRVTPVSRGWDFGSGYVIFDWDNLFLAFMASLDNKELAYSNAIQIIKALTMAGFVPNYSSGLYKSRDRTEPCIGVKVVSTLYHRFKDRWFLELLYPDLLSWNTWFWNYRRHEVASGLIVLGSDPNLPITSSDVNKMQGARYESGLDNSPMYDTPPVTFDNVTTHQMQLLDTGMSSLYAMETQLLADLAAELGKTGDHDLLTARAQRTVADMRAVLWDEAAGIYTNVIPTQPPTSYLRLTPTLFYPMLSGTPSLAQVEMMVQRHLTNGSEFCVGQQGNSSLQCTYALPSVAQSDPAFPDNNYWRGRIWGPMVQLVYWGLAHPAYSASAVVAAARKALCEQSKALLLLEWHQYRHVHENYNAITGEGGDVGSSDPFYHWGALTGFVSILEAGMYDSN